MIVSPAIYPGVVPAPACVALGMFDGLHIGHRAVIGAVTQKARSTGGSACVFTFDLLRARPDSKRKSAGRLLSRTMWEKQLDRWGIAHALNVDFAQFRDLSPEAFVRQVLAETLRAEFVACGENFHFGRHGAGTAQQLQKLGAQYGINVHIAPMVYADGLPVSATRIRDCVLRGDMPTAQRLLGRRFAVDFTVVTGRRLGRVLNSPTINQPFPEGFLIPRFGVYATAAIVDGQARIAVTNVGVKPTVGSDAVLAETYILNYTGDLYGKAVQVEFLQFMRPEEKFSSLEALRAQIHRDCAAAAEIGRQAGLYSPAFKMTTSF